MNTENLPPSAPVATPENFAEGEEIRIRLLKGPGRAWLSLSGTILTYRGDTWGLKECVDIPLELLVISKRKRFVGTRLILALLSLLVGPALGGAAVGIYSLSHASVPGSLVSICMATGVLIGVASFLILFVRFCIRESTIILNVAGGKMSLEFWAGKRTGTALGRLLQEVANRASTIEETIPFPLRTAAAEITHQPWKRTVLLTCLCAIPALMIENAWLFLLCLIPPARYLGSALKSLKMPTAFRQAVKCSLRQEWGDAQRYVDSLIEEHPDFLPAHLMRINLLCREGRFNDSEMALSRVEKELDLETVHGIQEELILRRRIWGRKLATTNGDRLIA